MKFLRVSGGWIRPSSIRWVNELSPAVLQVSVEGKEQPIVLKNEDADLLRAYLSSHQWQQPEEAKE
jgi:hypothetical protein